jgi:hypothetical protein
MLGDLGAVTAGAYEEAKAALYAALDLKLTYVPCKDGNRVEVVAAPLGVYSGIVSEGGLAA